MCSIAGYITIKEHSKEAQENFKNILVNAEIRGTDACGIAFNLGKNNFVYAKTPKKASVFTTEKIYKNLKNLIRVLTFK